MGILQKGSAVTNKIVLVNIACCPDMIKIIHLILNVIERIEILTMYLRHVSEHLPFYS